MEDAVLVLAMLFVLVMSSYMLDRSSCLLVSQSGFALVFGLGVGLLLLVTGKRESLNHHLNLDNALFFDVLLPPIIYEGGFSIKRQAFFRNFPAIMSTAVVGTVIATCITGGVLFAAGQVGAVPALSWVEAFLFGALISAVDPVATLACFHKLHAPPLLFNLVFGESVLNDAVAIALYQTLRKWQPDSGLSAHELLLVAANTGGMFVGSLLVSAGITLLGAFLLKREALATLRCYPTYEIALCLIVSLLTYFVADSFGLSGIVALFFSGTMTAHYQFYTISTEAQHALTHLLHTMAFICENLVYVFMGTSVILLFAGGHVDKAAGTALRVDDIDGRFIALTLAACVVARLCNVFPLLALANCARPHNDRIPVRYMTAIWFAGLRGSIAFALAKNWSYIGLHGRSHRKLIESTTLMVVLFTTIVIGGLTGPLLAALGLTDKASANEEVASDTGGSSSEGSTTNAASPAAAPRLQMRHVPRRSVHYIVSNHGVLDGPPFVEVPTSERTAQMHDVRGRDDVLTPRPQMVDDSSSDSDDGVDGSWTQRVSGPPLPEPAAPSAPTGTTAFLRSWQTFDASSTAEQPSVVVVLEAKIAEPAASRHQQKPWRSSSVQIPFGAAHNELLLLELWEASVLNQSDDSSHSVNDANAAFLSFVGAVRVDLRDWRATKPNAAVRRWYVLERARSSTARGALRETPNAVDVCETQLAQDATYVRLTLRGATRATRRRQQQQQQQVDSESVVQESTVSEPAGEQRSSSSSTDGAPGVFRFVLPSESISRSSRLLTTTRVGEIVHENDIERLRELLPIVLFGSAQAHTHARRMRSTSNAAHDPSKALQLLQLACQYAHHCTTVLDGNARAAEATCMTLTQRRATYKATHRTLTQQRTNLRRERQVLDSALDGMRMLLHTVDPVSLERLVDTPTSSSVAANSPIGPY